MKRTHRHTLLLLTAVLIAGLAAMAGPATAQETGEIDISIEPESSTLQPGETQTYEVVVEGPDSGIGAYDGVVVDLSDPSVGDIVGFEEQFDGTDGYSNSEIRNNNATLYLEAITGDSFASPADNVTIATFDLLAAEDTADGDATDIAFDSTAPQTVADFENVEPYDVGEFRPASVTVSTLNEGEIDLAIEPETAALGPGETQTYEVIVRGPDSGIGAYDEVVVDLSDPSVGDIVGFEEQFDESSGFTSSNSEIRNNNATLYLEAITGESFAGPADEVVIATFDLQAAEDASDGDTTDIEFDSTAAQTVADFENVEPYDVVAFEAANMTVDVEFPAILELVAVEAPEMINITESLEVEYTIENQGDALGTESAVELVVDIVEPTVEDVDTDVEVGPGDSVTNTLVFDDFEGLGPGVTIDYTVELSDSGDNVSGTTSISNKEPEATISNLDIGGQGTDATIVQGTDAPVSLSVMNTGNVSEVFDITLAISEGLDDPILETEQSTGEVGPGETGTAVFEGVTDELLAGNYSVELAATSAGPDDFIFGDITVVEGESTSELSNLDIAGQGADATIAEGASEPIAVDVTNVGNGSGSFEVDVELIPQDEGRPALGEQSTGTVGPGDTETVVFETLTADLDTGEYVVELETGDDNVSGALTVEEEGSGESLLSNLDIAGQGSTATLVDGGPINVSVDVTNIFETGDTFEVTLQVGDGTAGTQTTALLDPGQSETLTFTGVAGDLGTGLHDVVASAPDNEVTGSLTVAPGVDVTGDGNPAADTTGDGLLNDIDGEGTFDIFDVQALFENLDRNVVQANPGLFAFGGDASSVTIIDVQSLFAMLSEP